MTKEYKRHASLEKCPTCGCRVDADAYRCPKCMIYFCFQCRRRVAVNDCQYQCLNQKCNYYGKLLCTICIDANVLNYTLLASEWTCHSHRHLLKLRVFVSTLIGFLVWIQISFIVGAISFISILILSSIFVFKVGKKESSPSRVVHAWPKRCIACHQPVESLV